MSNVRNGEKDYFGSRKISLFPEPRPGSFTFQPLNAHSRQAERKHGNTKNMEIHRESLDTIICAYLIGTRRLRRYYVSYISMG